MFSSRNVLKKGFDLLGSVEICLDREHRSASSHRIFSRSSADLGLCHTKLPRPEITFHFAACSSTLIMSQESEQKSIVSHTEQAHPTLSIDSKFLERNPPVVQSRDNMSVTTDTNFYVDDAGLVEGHSQHNTSNAESRGPILSNAEKLAHEIVQKKDEIVQKNIDPEPALRFVESICKSREWLDGAPSGEIHYVAEKQREGSLIVEPSTPVPKARARENGHAGWEYHYAQFGNEASSNLRGGGSAPPPSRGSENMQFR